MNKAIAISTTAENLITKAKLLAVTHGWDYLNAEEIHSENAKSYVFIILMTSNEIGLLDPNDKKQSLFYIDFLSPKNLYRLKHATLKNESIAKAMGLKPKDRPYIIDATAGLGQDSLILAYLGFQVILLERSPIIYLLLKDGLERAGNSKLLADKIGNLTLFCTEAKDWLSLNTSQKKPDIIYLDPMFPKTKKHASVKKEMVILRNLLGNDNNLQDFFDTAYTSALKRVVIKRPRIAPYLTQQKPNFSITGKSSRFDVYLV